MSLSAGVGREITTPAIGAYLFGYNDKTISESVHDDLTVTALVLRGKTSAGAEECDRAKKERKACRF